jgi:ferredoxin-NADP reductase
VISERLKVRVSDVADVAEGVHLLRLIDLDGRELPAWQPGAHIDVQLPSGVVRQYSLCGSPADRSAYEIAVLREPEGRGGSEEIHTAVLAGTELVISGPRNRFPLHDAARYIFVGGGIGITPLLPMIEEVDRRGREWQLFYGGRSRGTMAFQERLALWPDSVAIQPQDEFGLLDLSSILRPQADTLVYCCGPEPLLEAVSERCQAWWPEGTLHLERFAAGQPTPTDGEATPFSVQLGLEGPVLEVPADRSVLDVLLDAGADVLFSCQEGTCGTCEVSVLAGRPDHKDPLLSPEERAAGRMLICVSRSLDPRLVLDIPP